MPRPNPTRIVVTGDQSFSKEVARILIEAGHIVREAGTPEDCLKINAEEVADVVVIQCPPAESAGLELCRKLRENPSSAGAAVLLDAASLIDEIVMTYPNFQPACCDIQVVDALPPVQANAAALTQVISNLLDNAVKFAKPGALPQVRIRAEEVDDWVRLWFEDKGIGIDGRAHKRIFGIFQSLHPHGAYEGTGIGLAIVRRAVERMGGKVGVQSQPGHGSRFWVDLKKGMAECVA
jgi:signal transduction histidine kinase